LRHFSATKQSQQYSDRVVAKQPYLEPLLRNAGVKYLHELDPTRIYAIDTQTLAVTSRDALSVQNGQLFGFGSATARISSPGADIIGQARTIVTCPFGAQTASVVGFMASTVSRDPIAGLRPGTLVTDNFLDSIAEVNFRILKVSGGARNPINRTTMETTHMGTCGGQTYVQNSVATWPPLRLGMVIDDTGSMGEELSGVQTALAEFIESLSSDSQRVQRDVAYDLVSFKDDPNRRLTNTTDTAAAIAAVNGLAASGGGDCPEDSLGALALELSDLGTDENSEGEIVFATDASPGSGNADAIIAQANAIGVKVNVMLSGDCADEETASTSANLSAATVSPSLSQVSAKEVFERIARETGGLYYFKPGGTVDDYRAILSEIFESAFTGGAGTPPVQVPVPVQLPSP